MSQALIIVESPAKARTLKRYLGKNFRVEASVGHIRDLPVKTLGVDVEHGFEPQYVTIRGKGKIIKKLKQEARKVDEIYLAPDPDREGEAIAFHIAEVIKSVKKPVRRVLFHELTKRAILEAIEKHSELNHHLFDAQQARRILDRLVGYQLSPLLWDKVRRGLSAGRVQSVAVRMVCEREQAIEDFVSEEYWTIDTTLNGPNPPVFNAHLEKVDGKKAKISSESEASAIVADLKNADIQVAKVSKKEKKRYPAPPFITSSMQMDANRKLRFSAKKTMTLAQRLYEGIELGEEGPTGLITYMRTDSTRLAGEAVAGARDYIDTTYGKDYLPAKPNTFKTKKSAQDAHEAIRPTDVNRTPESLKSYLEKDMLALYTLIWKRFVACQMAPARFDQTSVNIAAGQYGLKVVGTVPKFPGFMTLYSESPGENAGKKDLKPGDGKEVSLPSLQAGDVLKLEDILPKQHFTQPPPRYSEATLVKALEENGVGRPSTYASIISTIQEKEYVRADKRRFSPTDLGKLVNELLVEHFPAILDIEFTASMEENLDKVEEGKMDWLDILQGFYDPFKKTLEKAKQEMKSVKKSSVPTDFVCPECQGKLVIKWGRMGEFLACENFPQCRHTQDFQRKEDGSIEPVAKEKPEDSGESCEKCGSPMVFKKGRFGTFLACSGYPKCKNVRAQTIGVSCPESGCAGELVQKISKRGKVFYSCNKYPKCTFASWDKPVNEKCPDCDSVYLLEKLSAKKGNRLVCPNKLCDYFKLLPSEDDK